MANEISGAQALVNALEDSGVDVMFGIPGGAILPAYDPIFDSKIRHILVRHEQGAGHAATGYAQVTGRVGVCIATSGPGATNLVHRLLMRRWIQFHLLLSPVKFLQLRLELMHSKRLIFAESQCR
jgi:Thiamine pyrophosphate-requiring enzymes [acetolactate synthase, pyruvate dehydrogenase (cytochrome), glyoxylate carboligase, phosphonopyruvate decarboxylase]